MTFNGNFLKINELNGDVDAINVVVYKDVNGDIVASGEKAVVVVFGDVSGDIYTNGTVYINTSSASHVYRGQTSKENVFMNRISYENMTPPILYTRHIY